MNQPRHFINRAEQAQAAARFVAERQSQAIQDRLIYELRVALRPGKSRQIAELDRMFSLVDPRSER